MKNNYAVNEEGYTVMGERDALEAYDEMLNEVYGTVKVAGYEYDTSRALKELDETAYRCGFNDWCDDEKIEVE